MTHRRLRFKLNDRIGKAEVTPDAVPLVLLKQFADEVGKFLAGSKKEVDISSFTVAVEKGSLQIVADGLPDDLEVWADLDQLGQEDHLHAIDRTRAAVVRHWQEAARKKTTRRYDIGVKDGQNVVITSASNFREGDVTRWVRAERYVRGFLYDAGGKESPNVHLQLPGNKTLPIRASREQLHDDKENRLYHEVLVRVDVEQNLDTGDLRDAQLIRFEDYRPAFDPDAFAAFVEEGSKAWRDIGDPVEWVRAQRGS